MLKADQHIYQILTKRPGLARYKINYLNLPLPPHIWLGVSVEDQQRADHRIPILLDIPAKVRFLSCEPLLGPIDLSEQYWLGMAMSDYFDVYSDIDWVIVGGESGPARRPMDIDWARTIRDQCVKAGVAFFYKQGNSQYPGQDTLLDGQEWHEYPAMPEPVTQGALL